MDHEQAWKLLEVVLTTFFTAGFVTWLVQLYFKKREEKEAAIKEIQNFNVAFVYIAAIKEEIFASLQPSLRRVFLQERRQIKKIQKLFPDESLPKFFPMALPSFHEVRSSEFSEKISVIGKYYRIPLAFSRMILRVLQYNFICDERNQLVKVFTKLDGTIVSEGSKIDCKYIAKRLLEINNLSLQLLSQAEAIYDASFFLGKTLNDVSKEDMWLLKKKHNINDVRPINIIEDDWEEGYRQKLKRFLDRQTGISKTRHLEMSNYKPLENKKAESSFFLPALLLTMAFLICTTVLTLELIRLIKLFC